MPIVEANGREFEFPEGTTTEQIGSAIDEYFGSMQQPQAPVEEPSFYEKAKDLFTGESRETRATEELPELEDALIGGDSVGFLSTLDPLSAAKVAGTIAITEDPQERANILKQASPDFGIQYDEKGNIIAANNKTGHRVVLNKPGLSASDLFPASGQASSALPAAALGGPAAITAGTAATTAGIEGIQASQGGEFNEENVILDLIGSGLTEYIPTFLRAARTRRAAEAAQATEEAAQAEASRISQGLSPEAQLAQQTELTEQVAKQAQARKPDLREIASDAAPDPQITGAAERLGVDEVLTPGQVSSSQTYRELEGTISAVPASQLSAQQKEAASAVAQKADDFITEFGGTTDKSALSERLKDDLLINISDLEKQAEIAYKEVNSAIPKTAKVNTDRLTNALNQTADELGGIDELEGVQKKLLDIATSNPTYAKLDLERRKIGQALNRASGPYKDSESGQLKYLYSVLTDVQEDAAAEFGADQLWNTAKGLVSQRKTLEEQSISLLGKDKAGAIMPKLGRATRKLSGGDYKDFDNIIKALPKDQREAAVLSAMNDVFTQGSRKEKQLSPAGFVDWYESLNRNQAARKRITANLPAGAAQRLEDIYQVSKGIRNLSAERVRTGVIQGLLSEFDKADGMVAKLYQTGKRVAAAEGATSLAGFPGAGTAGAVIEALSKKKGDPITKSADALLSSQEFKRAVNAYADTSVRAQAKQKAAERALEKSEKYQRWLDLLPDDDKRQIIRAGLVTWLSGESTQPEEQQL